MFRATFPHDSGASDPPRPFRGKSRSRKAELLGDLEALVALSARASEGGGQLSGRRGTASGEKASAAPDFF